jgi:UDP-N-acetylmuramoylalanine--D-glutamate ligase
MQSFDYKNFFKDKKITKQGFGVLGRGYGVVKFLLESGAEVLVTDIKPRETFFEQIIELKKYEDEGKLKYVFGEHRDEDFTNGDFVIAGSGVSKDNYYINLAKKNNIQVYQETSLFAKLVMDNFKNVKIIGVTGTRGKTTTTFLIYELLKKSFGEKKVHIGGNVQGVATLETLKKIKDGDYVVLELDSWVLQGFNDLKISPNISVFTSFMPDHMNYYKNNLERLRN